jgi:uncharacterized protein YdbL (DUF1318 family)
MTIMRRLFLLALLVVALGPFSAGSAAAADLDGFRAQGVIAERFDGYVELRDAAAPAAAKSLVDQVNAKRAAIYKQRAQTDNVSVDDVGKIYAAQILNDAPAGTYFKQSDGSYTKK